MNQIVVSVTSRYLWIPIDPKAEQIWVDVLCEEQLIEGFGASISDQPTWYAAMDVSAYHGKELTLQSKDVLPERRFLCQKALPPGTEKEKRPSIHFTAHIGWLNDPNGLFCLDGTYHLFFQHNPYGIRWGNMHWGHAISTDLLYWKQDSDVLSPDETGTMFSGCAIVDWENKSGLGDGQTPPVLLYYTSDAASYPHARTNINGVYIAWSADRGKTFRKLGGPSILEGLAAGDRDPKVVWVEELQRWLMPLYKADERMCYYAVFESHDLLHWSFREEISLPGDWECPDLIPLWLNGDPAEKRWVFWGARGMYRVGRFCGEKLVLNEKVQSTLPFDGEPDYYAAQTYHLSDRPQDGTALQMQWLRHSYHGVTFNHQMSFPLKLTLKGTDGAEQLCMQPAPEAAASLLPKQTVKTQDILEIPDLNEHGTYLRLRLADAAFDMTIAGQDICYRDGILATSRGEISLLPLGGSIVLEAVVDGPVVELFWQDGRHTVLLESLSSGLKITFAHGGWAEAEVYGDA